MLLLYPGRGKSQDLQDSQHNVQKILELIVDQRGSFDNLRMAQLHRQNTGSHVGDTADANHLQTALAGNQSFRHGGHAYGIGTKDPEHTDLCGGLIVGTGVHGVNTFLQADTGCSGFFFDGSAQIRGVQIRHIWETGTKGIQIGADQGIGTGEIDMIGDQHEIAGAEAYIYAAAGIGQYQRLDAQGSKNPYGQGDLLLGKTFIVMDPALEYNHSLAAFLAEDQCAAVSGYSRNREVGDFAVRDADSFRFWWTATSLRSR